MKNRIFALLLAVLMLLCLAAGCSKDSGNDAEVTTPKPTGAPTSSAPATSEPADEEVVAFKLPIVDEPVTLSIWRGWTADGINITSADEIASNKWLEQKTNIDIEWVTVSSANFQEAYNLMIASLDYEDMISCSHTSYIGGIDKAIEDEVYLDASPFVNKYMPNFAEMRNAHDEVKKMTTTDSGNVFVSSVLDDDLFVWIGPLVKYDWMKELGYDNIENYDDLYNYLTDVKNVKGIEESLYLTISEETSYCGLIGGFDTSYGFYQVDGTVKFGPMNDGFREYISTLAKWFSEGLVWKDYIYGGDMNTPITRFGNNELAYMANGYYGYTYMMSMITGVQGDMKQVPFVSKEAGTVNHFRIKMDRAEPSYSIFVTSAAAGRGVAELCFRWIDARFSEEVALVCCYGIENEDWVYGPDGTVEFTPEYNEIVKTQSKYGFERADRLVACRDIAARDYVSAKANGMLDVLKACDVWTESANDDWVLPPVTLTAEEAEEYATLYTDIKTYVEEFSNGVIAGNTKLDDASWNAYVNQLKTMGIERCIELQQDALDRYNAR